MLNPRRATDRNCSGHAAATRELHPFHFLNLALLTVATFSVEWRLIVTVAFCLECLAAAWWFTGLATASETTGGPRPLIYGDFMWMLYSSTMVVFLDLWFLWALARVVFVAVCVSYLGMLGALAWKSSVRRGHEKAAHVMAQLERIPLPDAAARAQVFLADPLRFRAVPTADLWTADVHATVLQLFDGVELIESVRGELRMSRADVAECSFLPGWDKIGTDLEHTDIIVERSTGRTMQHDGDVQGNAAEIPYPSVFHFILSDDDELWASS